MSLPALRRPRAGGRPTIPAYHALASALVHPAVTDQWGLVVNEAMAAGLPVLVPTGAECAADLVREGESGFTFAVTDVGGLARRLHTMAHEADLEALARRSRELIAAWPLALFGTSLHRAVLAGTATAHRGLTPSARLLLWALRKAARGPNSFHTVQR